MILKKKAFENIDGKGENASKQHFLLFPTMFSNQSKIEIINCVPFNLQSTKLMISV